MRYVENMLRVENGEKNAFLGATSLTTVILKENTRLKAVIAEQKLKAPTGRKRGHQPKASEDQPTSSAISMCSWAQSFTLMGCLF